MNVLHEESVQYCSVNYSYIAVCHQGGIVFDDATVATSNNRRNLSRHISQDPRHHDHRRSVSFWPCSHRQYMHWVQRAHSIVQWQYKLFQSVDIAKLFYASGAWSEINRAVADQQRDDASLLLLSYLPPFEELLKTADCAAHLLHRLSQSLQ
jgi:hypothetical protein